MALWCGSVRCATCTISPHCSPPALLACQCNLNKRCLQSKLHTTLNSLHRIQNFAQPTILSAFSHRTCCTSSVQSFGALPPKTTTALLRAHNFERTQRYHQASTRGLLNREMCVPLCWKHHALILKHARAAPCILTGGVKSVEDLQTNKQTKLLHRQRVQPCQHTHLPRQCPQVCHGVWVGDTEKCLWRWTIHGPKLEPDA